MILIPRASAAAATSILAIRNNEAISQALAQGEPALVQPFADGLFQRRGNIGHRCDDLVLSCCLGAITKEAQLAAGQADASLISRPADRLRRHARLRRDAKGRSAGQLAICVEMAMDGLQDVFVHVLLAYRISRIAYRVSQIAYRLSHIAYRVSLIANRGSLIANRGSLIANRGSRGGWR